MLKKIISFFKNSNIIKTENVEILDGVYFHEDFFRQVEFCPRENFEYLKLENKQVNEFSRIHSDGKGLFTDIYVREENNQKNLFEKQILLTELDLVLINLGMQKIEKVYSGYSTYKEKCKNAIAYKFDQSEIFIFTENNFIKDFFVNRFRLNENQLVKNKLEEILFTIGQKYDLILNDWDITEVIDLSDRRRIQKYLNDEF